MRRCTVHVWRYANQHSRSEGPMVAGGLDRQVGLGPEDTETCFRGGNAVATVWMAFKGGWAFLRPLQ